MLISTSLLILLSYVSSLKLTNSNDISCPLIEACGTKEVDGCCVPKMGIVLFSQQWVDRAGPSDKFTIHGFWPDYCDGRHGPRNGCDRNRHYPKFGQELPSLNKQLYDDLNLKWPSYKGDNPSFWSHEWSKHGTCLSTFEPRCFGSEYKKYDDVIGYFGLVLNLYDKYDLYAILSKAGIKPGRNYPKDKIISAIENNSDLKVSITCRGKKLQEIRTWFQANGKSFNPIGTRGGSNCPSIVNFPKKIAGKAYSEAKQKSFVLQDVENTLWDLINGNW